MAAQGIRAADEPVFAGFKRTMHMYPVSYNTGMMNLSTKLAVGTAPRSCDAAMWVVGRVGG